MYIINDEKLLEMETLAIGLATEAGAILRNYFGKPLEVKYKDDKGLDPVTAVDKEIQDHIARGIFRKFPDHGLLGEEDEDLETSQPAPEFVWVIDPLDGTRNFICGLPIYSCSIGLLHQGEPVVGAIFTPWPTDGRDGLVLHARRGGGCYIGDASAKVFAADEPASNWLTCLPGSFWATHNFDKPMLRKTGDIRTMGSIAYELAMVAQGVIQYAFTAAPRLWDVAAGVLLVKEAGGLIMRQSQNTGLFSSFSNTTHWRPADPLIFDWQNGQTSMKCLREWKSPLLFGCPGIVRFVAAHIKDSTSRSHPLSRWL